MPEPRRHASHPGARPTAVRWVTGPQDLLIDDVYVDLQPVFGRHLALKCEGFNFVGSVKNKAAASMVAAAEARGVLRPGSVIVESSSGSLGVALSAIAAHRGYRFVCVTDLRCNERTLRLMEALGAEVVVISEPDASGGYLASRIRHVRELCAATPGMVWLNQYANEHNWRVHYNTTGPAILAAFPALDFLFIGAGTTGTLTGCARFLRDQGHPARIIAVDTVGSVTFGGAPGPRYIPGLGTSERPQIVDESVVDEVVMVPEAEAVRMCRALAGHGFLFGGSTGTVLAGAWDRLRGEPGHAQTVAIAPDFGERYLDSVYDDAWVREHFGDIGGPVPGPPGAHRPVTAPAPACAHP